MIKVVGVRFRTTGKIYFFDPLEMEIKRGDHVIVETARGIEFGTVMTGVTMVEEEKVVQPLKPVIRIANERDVEQEASNKIKEREAFKTCQEKIRKHNLDMKLIDAEYTFDNNKVLFYFTADGRIDFRELVKDLASVFKTRIELRQIGVRDETKIVGGIGICGRPLCCHSYLSDFIPVSIKMAKEQNLSLNPTKISGVCGRLMCCLKNEEDTYEELNRRLPGIGDMVTADDGLRGEVQSVNVLRQLVKVVVESGDTKEIKEYPVERLQFRRKNGGKQNLDISEAELRELEKLEDGVEEAAEGSTSKNRPDKPKNNKGNNRDKNDNRGRDNRNRENRNQENRNQETRNQEARNSENKNAETRNPEGKEQENKRQDSRGHENRNRDNRGRDNRNRDNRNHEGRTQDNRNPEGRNPENKREGHRPDGRRDTRGGRDGENRQGDRNHHRRFEGGKPRQEGQSAQNGQPAQNGQTNQNGN